MTDSTSPSQPPQPHQPHPFDAAIALQARGGDSFAGSTHPAYGNMVGPYGGITAAQAINAVLQHPQRLGDPVSLTINFCAALADGAFTITARPARTNRSTQHWVIEVVQDGATVVTATAFTATRRDTWNADEHAVPAGIPRPADLPPGTGRGRVEWINRYELRFVEGAYPTAWQGADHGNSRTLLWARDNPPRQLDHASLTALADVFFPRIWLRRAAFVPVGTVSMTVYYHADAAQLAAAGTGYVLAQAQGQTFRDGYFDESAQLWDEAGRLLVTSHQVVYYKE